MTKNGPELKSWPAEPTATGADSRRAMPASLHAPAASTVLSEEAVHIMLETTAGAGALPMRHELELQGAAHAAAVEAARDGICTPVEECEPPHHHHYEYEVADPSTVEPPLDSFAETQDGLDQRRRLVARAGG